MGGALVRMGGALVPFTKRHCGRSDIVGVKPGSSWFAARFSTAVLVLGGWFAFSLMLSAISTAIDGPPPAGRSALIELNALLAIPWTTFTFLIAAWHRRMRRPGVSARRLVVVYTLDHAAADRLTPAAGTLRASAAAAGAHTSR